MERFSKMIRDENEVAQKIDTCQPFMLYDLYNSSSIKIVWCNITFRVFFKRHHMNSKRFESVTLNNC